MRTTIMTFALAMLATGACASHDDTKGVEDDIPDGKSDSFGSPSAHGELRFGAANQAAFTDASGFHAWTFSLTGAAAVELATRLDAPNLDTVIYLYKRTSSSAAWGQAIARNDDAHDDTAASRLALELGKGEYRLLVKAYKRTQRGAFSVDGACIGGGCPEVPVCEAPETMPSETGYGEGCRDSLAAALEGPVASSNVIEVSAEQRCTLTALERRALDYYLAYWGYDAGGDTSFSIESAVRAAGAIVDIDDGGDESGMTFLFDADRELLVSYQHNQSPDVGFYCRTGAEIAFENPEDCVGSLIGDSMPSLSCLP